MTPVPLFLIIVSLPLLLGGCGGKDESTTEAKPLEEKVLEVKEEVKPEEPLAETEPPEIEKEELPPIPDKVTKEFVIALWDQPNDETNVIEEIKNHLLKSGVWKIKRRMGPNKNELVNSLESAMIMKHVNQRYSVFKVSNNFGTYYSAITYDYDKEKFHWWEFGESSGKSTSSSNEYSGQLLDNKLIEWESVVSSTEGLKIKNRERIKNTDSIKFELELLMEGKVVMVAEDIATWSEELPAQKNNP